jgi:hypothetical protein
MANGGTEQTGATFRSLLKHESEVTNHRMSWLGTFQGFLFAALGLLWQGNEPSLIIVLCFLGMIISAMAWWGLLLTALATCDLNEAWNKLVPPNYAGPPIMGFGPKKPQLYKYLLTPWGFSALSFVIVWAIILGIELHRPPIISQPCSNCPSAPEAARPR